MVSILGVLALAASALSWWATASGRVSYVTTRGSSMESAFHDGDLVVVRPAGTYRVGDVVAYRSSALNAVVVHRIVDRADDGYVLKGDNNPFVDADRPTNDDLIGLAWIRVPEGGHVVTWVHEHLLLVLAVLVVAAGGGSTAVTVGRTRRRRTSRPMPQPARSSLYVWRAAVIVLVALTATSAALGALAYTRQVTEPTTAASTYTHDGEFTYHASAPAGPVYETGTVDTGDPVYLRLVSALDVGFRYRFTAEGAEPPSGTIALSVEVADGTGWSRRIHLQRPTAFSGDEARTAGRLALADLQALVNEVRMATAVNSGTATLTVQPAVEVEATLDETPVTDRFEPRLAFQLDPLQLRILETATSPGADGDPLHPRATGTVERSTRAPAQLAFLGRHLAVADARRLALVAIPAAMAALTASLILHRRLRAETARIALRHGHRIVPVATGQDEADDGIIDVTTIEDLVRLAAQEGCLILHHQSNGRDIYVFQSGRTIYRYRPRPRSSAHHPL